MYAACRGQIHLQLIQQMSLQFAHCSARLTSTLAHTHTLTHPHTRSANNPIKALQFSRSRLISFTPHLSPVSGLRLPRLDSALRSARFGSHFICMSGCGRGKGQVNNLLLAIFLSRVRLTQFECESMLIPLTLERGKVELVGDICPVLERATLTTCESC